MCVNTLPQVPVCLEMVCRTLQVGVLCSLWAVCACLLSPIPLLVTHLESPALLALECTSAWSWHECARDQLRQGLCPGVVFPVVFQTQDLTSP